MVTFGLEMSEVVKVWTSSGQSKDLEREWAWALAISSSKP